MVYDLIACYTYSHYSQLKIRPIIVMIKPELVIFKSLPKIFSGFHKNFTYVLCFSCFPLCPDTNNYVAITSLLLE